MDNSRKSRRSYGPSRWGERERRYPIPPAVVLALLTPLIGCENIPEFQRGAPAFSMDALPTQESRVMSRACGSSSTHEPDGYVVLADQPWSTLAEGGWSHLNRSSQSLIVRDSTAPASAPEVLEHRYPAGFEGGREPAVDWIPVTGRAVYVSTWMKVSDPWTNHRSSVNKIWFLHLGEADGPWVGNFYLHFLPSEEPGRWRLRMWPGRGGRESRWVTQNVSDESFATGEWVHVEALVQHVTGEQWHVKWWLNGVLATDDSSVSNADTTFAQFEIAPTWGGMGGTKPREEHLRFDHVCLSQPDLGG